MKQGDQILVDSNTLIDSRFSISILEAIKSTSEREYLFEEPKTPEIIIPNIVSFEIKSMMDRQKPKEIQYSLAEQELLRIRALHDAGYVKLSYVGETPLIPPIAPYEKGTWKFVSSLRDEYILRVMSEFPDSTLVTSDGRLARSSYLRGYKVLLLKPLIKEIKDKLETDPSVYQTLDQMQKESILHELCADLLIPKDTIQIILKNLHK